jgi:hypothetical protein
MMFLHGADAILAIARVRAAEGRSGRAEELAGRLVAAAQKSGWPEPFAAGSRLLAELRLLSGETPASEQYLRYALARTGDADLPGERWRAHAELARVLIRRGDTSGARAELDKATGIVDRLAAGISDGTLRRTFLDGFRACCPWRDPATAAYSSRVSEARP